MCAVELNFLGIIYLSLWEISLVLCRLWSQMEREGPPVVGPNPLPDLTHVVLACESSSYLDPDFYTFAVLNSLMGGGGSFSAGGPGKGMYTRLYQDVLTRHHWIYSALAQNHAYSDSGIFCLFGSAAPAMVSGGTWLPNIKWNVAVYKG